MLLMKTLQTHKYFQCSCEDIANTIEFPIVSILIQIRQVGFQFVHLKNQNRFKSFDD